MTSDSVVLEVSNLSVTYPGRGAAEDVRALDGVSLTVLEGETLGVVGESGSGKSTLAKVIVRLVQASAGQVRYRGVDVLDASKQEARFLTEEVQIVFQDPFSAMHPRHTVQQALTEAIHASRDRTVDVHERLGSLLESVGLSMDKLDSYPHQLSGGQCQRVAIARALAVSPKLVVADECVSALDVSVQSAILNLMLTLQEDMGLSYIFVSHDLAVVHHMSDRIVVMKDGRVVESGEADQIMYEPSESYTKELLASVPGLRR